MQLTSVQVLITQVYHVFLLTAAGELLFTRFPKFATDLNVKIRHSSKSIWALGDHFGKKDSLITCVLFELCLANFGHKPLVTMNEKFVDIYTGYSESVLIWCKEKNNATSYFFNPIMLVNGAHVLGSSWLNTHPFYRCLSNKWRH